tara:strand:+ start:106 stop:1308 length:1203 start_codon:yes stop_codon:yes gene_type:complete
MEFNNAHVFVVDADSYPVHRDRLFCGIKNPNKLTKIKKTGHVRPNTSYYGLIADLVTLRKGDYIIFYQMRKDEAKFDRGFRGVFRVVSEPFFDENNIEGLDSSIGSLGSKEKKVLGKCPHCGTNLSETAHAKTGKKICKNCRKELDFHILPNRVLIEPIKLYEDPIDDNTAYIDRNFISEELPVLWTMLFRKTSGAGRARSITHILPEEYNKLIKIFETNCKVSETTNFEPYEPENKADIKIPLDTDEEGELKVEAFLEAWIMSKIGREDIEGLKEIIGNKDEIEYFGNNVLYGIGGEKVDVLVIKNNGTERTEAVVIELKKGAVTKKDLNQIRDYTKWMAQLVFGDDKGDSKLKIQPVLIGHRINEKIIKEAKKSFDTKPPILMEYKIKDKKIIFNRVL